MSRYPRGSYSIPPEIVCEYCHSLADRVRNFAGAAYPSGARIRDGVTAKRSALEPRAAGRHRLANLARNPGSPEWIFGVEVATYWRRIQGAAKEESSVRFEGRSTANRQRVMRIEEALVRDEQLSCVDDAAKSRKRS